MLASKAVEILIMRKEQKMAVKTPPEGYHTITPYLTVREVEPLAAFVKQVFGAQERFRGTGSAGGLHVELTLGDSMLMIGGGSNVEKPDTAMIHLYLEHVDTIYKRAIEAGASSISEPTDRPYGDRVAGVKDPFGNTWYIATHIADVL
jgi:PhnB protein